MGNKINAYCIFNLFAKNSLTSFSGVLKDWSKITWYN